MSKNKIRVAVCLSGEIRTVDYCYKSILETFPNADFFCHAWTSHRKWDDVHGPYRSLNIDNYNNAALVGEKIKRYFSPKKVKVETPLKSASNTRLRTLSMYKGIYLSNLLKRQYEFENNFKYDLVIRSRYDLIYRPGDIFIPCKTHSKVLNVYNFPTHESTVVQIGISDLTFYGNSHIMDIVSNIFNFLEKDYFILNENVTVPSRGNIYRQYLGIPESTLFAYLLKHRILPIISGKVPEHTIYRENAEGLHYKHDYEKIREIANNIVATFYLFKRLVVRSDSLISDDSKLNKLVLLLSKYNFDSNNFYIYTSLRKEEVIQRFSKFGYKIKEENIFVSNKNVNYGMFLENYKIKSTGTVAIIDKNTDREIEKKSAMMYLDIDDLSHMQSFDMLLRDGFLI